MDLGIGEQRQQLMDLGWRRRLLPRPVMRRASSTRHQGGRQDDRRNPAPERSRQYPWPFGHGDHRCYGDRILLIVCCHLNLHCLQLKHVEVPGTVIDEETVINKVGAVAIVNLGPHSVGQAYLPAAKFREWQRQSALPLVSGVIDDDDMAGAVPTGPGRGDEAIRGPVVGPGGLRLDLRPGAVAKGRLLQYSQQSGIKGSDLRVCRLDRTAAEVGRHSDPSSLKLALMEEPQSRG